jgi:hypothetical protein
LAAAFDGGGEEVGQPAGEVQHGGGRRVILRERRVAGPADLDAAVQVGLGAAEAVEPRRGELLLAEDLGVRPEADGGAAAVVDRAGVLQLAERLAAGIGLGEEGAVARHLHLQPLAQRVDDTAADAVQAARGVIGLAAELAARMEGGEDDLEGRELREFRVRVGRDAPPVVAHRQPVAGLQRHLDAVGMAGHRLVHGVVDDLGGEVVQGVLIRAADIHPRPAADGLQPLQNLDILGGVGGRLRHGGDAPLAARAATAEKIVHVLFP